ncbi:MAG: hypothetical protein WD025_01715 [Bacteriovoracaceae bacterium]
MKRIILIAIIFFSIGLASLGALLGSPYYFYNKIVSENYRSKWYFLENFDRKFVNPDGKIEAPAPDLGNEDLWKTFHFKDTLVPLPVRNPFYYVAPIAEYDKEKDVSRLGLTIYGTGYREISKLYFVSNMFMSGAVRSQELFKLPLSRKIIQSVPSDKVWRDIFKKPLSNWNIPFSEMIYNLYLLQLRTTLLPRELVSFGALNDNTGVARLKSKNKDYITELVMTKSRGIVYSYLIITEKNNGESDLLRYKFLRDIGFRPGSESLAGIIYKEFKALPYKRKVDHEGMMYLLSAWSHQMDNEEYLKEMILYLERGEDNQRQLKPLYQFANEKYDKTFTRRLVRDVELDSEMRLKRDIELEEKEDLRKLKNRNISAGEAPLTEDQKIKNRIEEAKRSKRIKPDRMIID